MQKQFQIIFLIIGLIVCTQINQKQSINPNDVILKSFLQKGELAHDTIEGVEGIKIIEKMISDLENEDTQLHKQAKTDFDTCKNNTGNTTCKSAKQNENDIKKQNKIINQLEKQNKDSSSDISKNKKQKEIEQTDYNKKSKIAIQKIKANYENIINMIKKIIKVMVDTYKINSTENLSGVQVFIQQESLLQLQSEVQTATDMNSEQEYFQNVATMLIQQTIQAMIEKRYDEKNAQKFVNLMEGLIAKLRQLLKTSDETFKLDDTDLKKSFEELDNQNKKSNQDVKKNKNKISEAKKKIAAIEKQAKKCEKKEEKIQKCKNQFESDKKIADANDDLIEVLKKVLQDTKDLLGNVDENYQKNYDDHKKKEAAKDKAEEEAQQKKKDEEAAKKQAKIDKIAKDKTAAKNKAAKDKADQKKKDEADQKKKDEADQKKKDEAAAKKEAEEEAEQKKKDEEAAAKQAKKEEAAKKAKEAAKKAEEEAAAKKASKKAQEEAAAKQAAVKKAEEASKQAKKEAAAKQAKKEEAAAKKAKIDKAAKKAEEASKKAAEASKKAEEVAAAKQAAVNKAKEASKKANQTLNTDKKDLKKDEADLKKDEADIDSVIATKDQQTWIFSQVEKVSKQEQKFKLCFRASRDGFQASKFHTLCDNKGPTLTIATSSKTDGKFVFGGYTPLAWSSSGAYKQDLKSFVFSADKKKIIGKNNNSKSNSIYDNKKAGPSFGDGQDLTIADNGDKNENSTSSMGSTYECPEGEFLDDACENYLAGKPEFKMIDWEVYQVVKA